MPIRVVTEAPTEPRTPRWVLLLVGVVVLAVLLGGAFWLGSRANQDPPPQPTPTPTEPRDTIEPSETTSGTTEPSPTQPVQGLPEHMTVAGEVVPGLWQGTAPVASGHANAIYGTPVGWSRTVDGAVAAAMNIDAAFYTLPAVIEDTQAELNRHLYTGEALEAMVTGEQSLEFRRQLRELCRLDDSGVVVGADGLPSQHETYYGGGIPRYGAYQVRDVEHEAGGVAPERVEIAVLQPVYRGPGNDTNMTEVLLMFSKAVYVMVWDGDDWRVMDWGPSEESESWVTTVSNQGYAHLVTLVGDGWAVPADATQDPIPGAVLTK